MTPERIDQLAILAILIATVAMFLWGRWRHDMVAMGALLVCVFAGLVPRADAFAGFGHPAVITVACVLVLSGALQSSGAVDSLTRRLLPSAAGPTATVAALTGLSALLSAFMNNVGALALLMPVAVQMAVKQKLPPGRVLMPLAFGSILGGMTTLIGTPPNLIVSGFRAASGTGSFAMFDFTPVGLVVALAGVAFIVLIGRHLVPARERPGAEGFDTGAYLTEVVITADSKSAGKSLREIGKTLEDADAQIVGLIRDDERELTPGPYRVLRVGDILRIEAEPETLSTLLGALGLKLVEDVPVQAETKAATAVEAVAGTTPDPVQDPQRERPMTGAPPGQRPLDHAGGGASVAPGLAAPGLAASAAVHIPVDAISGPGRGQAEGAPPASHANVPSGKVASAVEPSAAGSSGAVPSGAAPSSAVPSSAVPAASAPSERPAEEVRARSADGQDEIALIELAARPETDLIGRSATDLQLRTRYRINLLALSRHGQRTIRRLRSERIRAGDVLLMQGRPASVMAFASEFGCVPLAERALRIPNRRQALMTSAIMLAAIAGAAFGLLPASISFAAGVLACMALRVVSLRTVYNAIDWPVIVLLAALIPVAGAMETTQAADLIAGFLMDNVAQGSPILSLVLILAVTMTLSDFMNNAATAAVMCPIAISAATQLSVRADSFLMAVAIGASCAFLTPIGHQNNTLILGPAGLRFGDYWRMGLPLEILVMAIAVPMLLWVWPLAL